MSNATATPSAVEFDHDGYAQLLREQTAALAEYGVWALWDRLPVDEQGDTSDEAWQLRHEFAEKAADRWVELRRRARAMLAEKRAVMAQ